RLPKRANQLRAGPLFLGEPQVPSRPLSGRSAKSAAIRRTVATDCHFEHSQAAHAGVLGCAQNDNPGGPTSRWQRTQRTDHLAKTTRSIAPLTAIRSACAAADCQG